MACGKQRNSALDVIRCTALFCVIGTHFFLYNGYYDHPVAGFPMYFLTILRSFMTLCVPLFLLLSGYLSLGKTYRPGYFQKLIPIVVIYVLASLACGLFYGLLMLVFQQEVISLGSILEG